MDTALASGSRASGQANVESLRGIAQRPRLVASPQHL
jgi:hypothetical protein